MKIRTTVPTLYKAAMLVYESIIEKHIDSFLVKITLNNGDDDFRLLRVFTELMIKIQNDFNVEIKVEMEAGYEE